MKQQKSDSEIHNILENIGVAALIAGAAILFSGCVKNNLEEIKAFATTENFPVIEAVNFETTVTDSGKIHYYLKAPKLLQFDNEGKTYYEFPEGIEMIQFGPQHQMESSITADYAIQFEKENKWEAKNNVIATNANGDTLKTEHLIYEVDNEKIYSDEFVTIIGPEQVITGYGFVSDQKMLNWKIKNPRGPIYIAVDEQQENDTGNASENAEEPKVIRPQKKPLDWE